MYHKQDKVSIVHIEGDANHVKHLYCINYDQR